MKSVKSFMLQTADLLVNSRLTAKVLKIVFSTLVSIPYDETSKKFDDKRGFFVVITVDTEPGYVNPDLTQTWHKDKPDAFEGYLQGIKNLRVVAEKYNVNFTYLLDTQAFAAGKTTYDCILSELKRIIRRKDEIGFHLHPKDDLALQNAAGKRFQHTSSVFYNEQEIRNMLFSARQILNEHLTKDVADKIVSFRWGNWGLRAHAIRPLESNGFLIDTSACPGIKGHLNDEMCYAWNKVRTLKPWRLNYQDCQDSENGTSKVLEIPITTAKFIGKRIMANPKYYFILDVMFDKYYDLWRRNGGFFAFVVITHSSEATYQDGRTTPFLTNLDSFLGHVKKRKDVALVTLKEVCDSFLEPVTRSVK